MYGELMQTLDLLDLTVSENKAHGLKMNAAEAKYYSIKDRRVRELLNEGKSSTAIQLIIKGEPEVNEALNAFNDAKVEYENSREGINAYKLRIRVLEAAIEREWEQMKRM